MRTIYKHEMVSYFTGLLGYVFGAFLLLFAGIYTVIYNLQDQLANFEYVPGSMQFVYLVMIPILSMRVLSEERRQKTDQLLYSLPVSMIQIVWGKYLAMLTVLLIPLTVIGIYPLVLSRFGEVPLRSAYGVLFAFFLLGAALLSVGMFISSLTESQTIAAGISFGVILLNYFIASLSTYVPEQEWFTLLVLAVLVVLAGIGVWQMLKSWLMGGTTAGTALAVVIITYIRFRDIYHGLIPLALKKMSLFTVYYTFVNGKFEWAGVAFYLSVIGVFVFLTVQSMEKRRWS